MKRVCCALLALFMVTSLAAPVFADESETVAPRLATIATNTVTISIDNATGIASCDALCYAKADYTVKVVCKLQRWTGSTWTTLKTWTNTDNYIAYVSEKWAVYSGYTYRVYATFYVYDSSGTLLETVSNSNSQTYM